uniref:Probable G-protein coupled receptor 33 n=1 Tax=Catagonus wagneri TaxID=51154 RepID=A0A8C3YRK4_9CETA
MDLINPTDYLPNVSTLIRNSIHIPTPASKMTVVPLLFTSSIIGTITNGFYLWVLKFKMRKTVNTLLYFHLILSYFISTLFLPFLAISYLQDNHWIFGMATCKIVYGILYIGMFASVFFLSAISVDRYLLTLHPVWSQLHRTPQWASSIILGVWISATALGIPYMVFRETHDDHKGMVTCQNNYAVSTNWESKKMQTLRQRIHVACFSSRFLLSFLLPFFIITFCYERVAKQMKTRGLFKSNKPFKVMMTAIISFFVCWMPYHVYQGLMLTKNQSLFFQKVFKKSVLTLFESTFNEDLSTERTQNLNSEAYI